MEVPDPFVWVGGPGADVHVHVVVDDLEQLAWLGDTTGLHLGPDWHVVEADLEGTRADQLSLHGIAEEEGHHTWHDVITLKTVKRRPYMRIFCSPASRQPSPESPRQRKGRGWRRRGPWGSGVSCRCWTVVRLEVCNRNIKLSENCLDRSQPVAARGKVVTTDGHLWVFLLQYTGILLKYLKIVKQLLKIFCIYLDITTMESRYKDLLWKGQPTTNLKDLT